jgi:site-specific recombinase XerD
MKVKSVTHRGEQQFVVDGRVNGKRKRMYFKKKKDADAWLKAEKGDVTAAQWFIDKSPAEKADLMNAFEQSREAGFKLLDAVHYYSVKGRGDKFLKKMKLGEAIGTIDRTFDHKVKPKKLLKVEATGFLLTRLNKGCSDDTLWTTKCTLHNLRDFLGANRELASITVDDIENWLSSGGAKKAKWTGITKENYNSVAKAFFNWAIKREYMSGNPSTKIDLMIKQDFDPEILTVEQCQETMETTLKHDPELLSYASLMLFCGLRPSEAQKVAPSDINLAKRRIKLGGAKTKTRRRRIINMSENAAAWFALGTFGHETWSEEKIVNVEHRWDVVRNILKKKWGLKKWPHDCLRHSFCSYYLAKHEDAAETALQAGHTEGVLFKHYRVLVEKEDAERFWEIHPPSDASKNMNLALVAGLLTGFGGRQIQAA